MSIPIKNSKGRFAMVKAKKKKTTKKPKKKPKNIVKPKKAKQKEESHLGKPDLKTFDDLLMSEYTKNERLDHLMLLSNVSFKRKELRESMVEKIMYESVLGLDEVCNLLYTEEELRSICVEIGIEGIGNKKKGNLIGMLVKALPAAALRKIITVIEESYEEERELVIDNLFIIHPDGVCLYSYNLEPISVGDVHMVTGALNAIERLLKEITKSKERLEHIDVGENKALIFEYGTLDLSRGKKRYINWNLIGVLLLNKESLLARNLLKEFLRKFEDRYEDDLYHHGGHLNVFQDSSEIVKNVFDFYF